MTAGCPPHVFRRTFDEQTPPSLVLIDTICAIENVDPVAAPPDLEFTPHDHIDPQSLDSIVANTDSDGDVVVEFTLDDYRVRIAETGSRRVQLLGGSPVRSRRFFSLRPKKQV